MKATSNNPDPLAATSEIQLLLAEKRTSLALMRTGIAVLALPLSILGLLVATSKYYDPLEVLHFLIPLALLLLFLIVFGFYLVSHAILGLRRYDFLIQRIKAENFSLADYLD
jgi:uncharacterized membrane protein YidH (DUF202 family)